MKALQLTDNTDERLQLAEVPIPEPAPGEVLIRLKAAALNHRDQWIRVGKYPGILPNVTLGSDGCGTVVKAGSSQGEAWLGHEVIINPNINWGDNEAVQSPAYSILGNPVHGTFAEYITVPLHRLSEKPAHLSAVQAAALPLAGLTAYRALMRYGQPRTGEHLLITGIGGGVAQMTFQFAKALGLKIFVTSGDEAKREWAMKNGAHKAYNYLIPEWAQTLLRDSEGLDIVIDGAGGMGFPLFIRMMRRGGRIVFYGATAGLPNTLDMHRAFFYQLRIQGSTMGNDTEFEQMVRFVDEHKIVPVLDSVRPLEQIISALDLMKSGKQLGKLVVSME
jgi:NADPH:quinone reductase-like Zn-dependent oxidoreductase